MSSDSTSPTSPRPSARRRRTPESVGGAAPPPDSLAATGADQATTVAGAAPKTARRRGKRGGPIRVEDAQIVEEQRLEIDAPLADSNTAESGDHVSHQRWLAEENLRLGAELALLRSAHEESLRLGAELALLRTVHDESAADLARLRDAHDATTAELVHLRRAHEETTAELARLRTAHVALGAAHEAEREALRDEMARRAAVVVTEAPSARDVTPDHRAALSALFDRELVPAVADLSLRVRALERYATAVLPPRFDQVTGVSRAAWRQLERIERLIETVKSAPVATS